MAEIEFIQFLGDKLRKRVIVDRPVEIAQKADALKARGFRLECKNIGDGDVMIAVADADMDFLLASRTLPNGPGLPEAVDALLTEVHSVMEMRDRAKRAAALHL